MLQVKPSGQNRYRGMPLSVDEFIRRWLFHVLPSGFHRVRYYGFLHSHRKMQVEEVRWLIALYNRDLFYLTCHEQLAMPEVAGALACPKCGGPMICVGYFPPLLYLFPVPRAPPDMSP